MIRFYFIAGSVLLLGKYLHYLVKRDRALHILEVKLGAEKVEWLIKEEK